VSLFEVLSQISDKDEWTEMRRYIGLDIRQKPPHQDHRPKSHRRGGDHHRHHGIKSNPRSRGDRIKHHSRGRDRRGLTAPSSSAWSVFADLLDPPESPYVRDAVGWVPDRLGEFLWSKQREILEAVVHHRYVTVKSAQDTGKSHGASRAVAWWLDTREDPFATTTAPTTKQIHAILWRASAGLIARQPSWPHHAR
jgi:hypothetical protein